MSEEVSKLNEKTLNHVQMIHISILVDKMVNAKSCLSLAGHQHVRAVAELSSYLSSIDKEKP